MKGSKFILSMLFIIVFTANAQKLPKIQEASVWAPDNIKIDGKLTEWNDQFQAYNVSNFIFYTISNNSDNLYLTVRMNGDYGSRKILNAGMTFTIIPLAENEGKVSVTYPALTDESKPIGSVWPMNPLKNSPYTYRRLNENPQGNKEKIDDLILTSNKQLKEFFKDVKVTGINETADTVISIYNPYGIRVGNSLNNQMDYIYELAIPLKYLGNSINKGEKFRYNIKLNWDPVIHVPGGGNPPHLNVSALLSAQGRPGGPPPMPEEEIYRLTPTDFSGECTLAKKK